MDLDMNEYQLKAARTAVYPSTETHAATLAHARCDGHRVPVCNLEYVALGLCSEAGEVAGVAKKFIRDGDGRLDGDVVGAFHKELGDVLWYLAQLATELGFPLVEVARANLDKLALRAQRGTLHGSGDNR